MRRQRKKDRKDRRKKKQNIEEDIYKIMKEEETVEWKDRC
jgi:hypothetical protein